MSKYGVISGPYFPVRIEYRDLHTGKYGREITPYLDTFHAVLLPHSYNSSIYLLSFDSVTNLLPSGTWFYGKYTVKETLKKFQIAKFWKKMLVNNQADI